MVQTYILSFIEGFLTFVSPCILPLLPVYLFYLAGLPAGGDKNEIKKRTLLINSLAFVIGFTIIFVLLGTTATFFGQFLKNNIALFRNFSGIIMIIFGLNFMGIFKIKLLNTEKRFHYNKDRLGFFSSIIFGMVFSFGWTPCIGSFLGSALLKASSSNTVIEGSFLLFVYSMGLGIPFILSALMFEKAKSVFEKIKKHQRIITAISGLVLIISGIITISL